MRERHTPPSHLPLPPPPYPLHPLLPVPNKWTLSTMFTYLLIYLFTYLQRDRQRHRQTERQRETERQTDRDRQAGRQTDRDRETQTDRQTGRQTVCLRGSKEQQLLWTNGHLESYFGCRYKPVSAMLTYVLVLDPKP